MTFCALLIRMNSRAVPSTRLLGVAALLLALVLAAAGCTAAAKKARYLGRADAYFKAGDYEKAKVEYLNALRVDPQSVAAIERLGIIWFEEGASLRAFPYLLGSRQVAPDALDVRDKLGLAYLSIGAVAEARKEALAILQKDPRHGPAALLLADTTASRDELAANEQTLRQLPDGNSAYVLQAKASLAMRSNSLATAQIDLERAREADPRSPTVHLGLAQMALLRKDPATAAKEFKTAAELSPPRSVATIKYADFQRQNGAGDAARALLADATRRAPDFLPAWQLQAQMASQAKDYDGSLALLEHVFTQDPDNLEAHLLQADDLLAKNDTKKGIEVLTHLDAVYRAVPVVKLRLARADLQANHRTQAIIALTQAVNAAPDYLEAVLLLADLNLQAGDAQTAATALSDLLQKHPNLPAAQALLAEADRVLGRLDESVRVLNDLIKGDANNPESYVLLGRVQWQQNKPAEARASFEQALARAPDDVTALAALVELDLSEKQPEAALQRAQARAAKTPPSAPAQFLLARVYTARKDWDHAEAALLKALELDPKYAPANDLLVSNDIAAGKLPAALQRINALLAKDPNNVPALMTSALIYDRQKDSVKARDAYEKILTLSPDSPSVLNNLAYLYAQSFNQLDKAYDLARRAHDLQPDEPAGNDTLGWVLYKRGDYQGALALLQTSSARLPEQAEITYHLAMANYMMGRTDAARKAFEQAAGSPQSFPGKEEIAGRLALLGGEGGEEKTLSIDALERLAKQSPGDPLVWSRLGSAYEKQAAWDKAAAAYEQARRLNPKLVPVLVRLAALFSGPLRDLNKAGDLAKSARDLAPNDPQTAASLGRVLYLSGNYARAYGLLQEGARATPPDAGTLRDLAWTTYYLGKVAGARQAMQNAVQADPGGSQTRDATDFLALTSLEAGSPDLAAAEPEVNRVLQADPGNVPARMAQAGLQAQRGDTKTAADGYLDILRRAPDFAPAQKCLAALYLADPATRTQAFDLAAKARTTLPDDPALTAIFAQANYQRKEYAYALQLFQESARRQPLDANSLFAMGMCYLQTKQPTPGVETLQQALRAGLREPLLGEARKSIEENQKK